jgi:hypothetical protein
MADEKHSYQYTMLPMVLASHETTTNPTDYLELLNALGQSGYELVAIHNEVFILKKHVISRNQST